MIAVEKPLKYKVSWNHTLEEFNPNLIELTIDAYDLQNLAHILTQNKIENFRVEVIK